MSFESDSPFVLSGAVTNLGAAAAGVLLDGSGTDTRGLTQVFIVNASAATIAVAFAPTAAAAQTNAAIPSSGTTSASGVTVLLAGAMVVFTAPNGQYWSSSATSVYIQCGTGN